MNKNRRLSQSSQAAGFGLFRRLPACQTETRRELCRIRRCIPRLDGSFKRCRRRLRRVVREKHSPIRDGERH